MPDEPEDLGTLLARATRRVVALERPLLDRHGLPMWGYVVLLRLAAGTARTQQALAADVGYDKTRLIGVLDDLAAAGLIDRTPDPADRRARLVTLTDAGRERLAAARTDVRAMERELLAGTSEDDTARLRAALRRVGG